MGDGNQKEDGSGRSLKNLVQRTGRSLAAANADREGENENRPKSQNPIFVACLNFRHWTKKVTGSATNCYLWFENCCAQWRNGTRRNAETAGMQHRSGNYATTSQLPRASARFARCAHAWPTRSTSQVGAERLVPDMYEVSSPARRERIFRPAVTSESAVSETRRILPRMPRIAHRAAD